jgi:hypothetical protein
VRVSSLKISDFKHVDVTIPWASALVLFGPNDSGKTNILEAITVGFAEGGEARLDRSRYPDEASVIWDGRGQVVPVVELEVELDGLPIEGNPDQELFLSFVGPLINETTDLPELEPVKVALCALPEEDSPERPRAVAEIIEAVLAVLREGTLARAADGDEAFEGVRDDRARVLDACLASRRFRITEYGEVAWLPPSVSQLNSETLAALERLREREGDSDEGPPLGDVWMELGEPELDGDPLPHFLRAVRIDFGERGAEDFFRRLERSIERALDYHEFVSTRGSRFRTIPLIPRDRWLVREGRAVSLLPAVEEACGDLAARANDLAPAFVSRVYEIRIAPHQPDEWRMLDGRRVSVRLAARSVKGAIVPVACHAASR